MKIFLQILLLTIGFISGIFITGWLYMLAIGLFHPVSYKAALGISLFVSLVVSSFRHGQKMKNDN